MDGDFLGDSFLGEKLKELFFFAGAVATPPRATSQAWAAAWPRAWATCVGVSPFVAGASIFVGRRRRRLEIGERPRDRRRGRLRGDAGEARGRRRDGQQGARDLDHPLWR